MELAMTETEQKANTNKIRVGLYFFKPKDWFGWLVVALQWLCGGKWDSPCHMMHSVDKWLFETTTEGTVCSNSVNAAFRLADDVFYIMVDEATAFDVLEFSACLREDNINFRLWDCVVFCWKLLNISNVEIIHSAEFGNVYNHLGQTKATLPFSCTSVVWYTVLDPTLLRWHSFTPASIYKHLKEHSDE
jgi:hypothetical protein